MSLRNQIRGTNDPQQFVQVAQRALRAGEDPNLITPDQVGAVTTRLFEQVGDNTHQIFTRMHMITHHGTQGTRLLEPFYRAIEKGLGEIGAQRDDGLQQWPEFFCGINPLLGSDTRLRKMVAAKVADEGLSSLVWSIDAKRPAHANARIIDTSTAIVQALGTVPELVAALDVDVIKSLVRAHVESAGCYVTAAPTLMKLRQTPPLLRAIVESENGLGHHFAAYAIKTNKPDRPGSTLISLEFNRDAGTVAAYALTRTRHNFTSEPIILGNGMDAPVAEALLHHTYADLPDQGWVVKIAEAEALRLG